MGDVWRGGGVQLYPDPAFEGLPSYLHSGRHRLLVSYSRCTSPTTVPMAYLTGLLLVSCRLPLLRAWQVSNVPQQLLARCIRSNTCQPKLVPQLQAYPRLHHYLEQARRDLKAVRQELHLCEAKLAAANRQAARAEASAREVCVVLVCACWEPHKQWATGVSLGG